LEKGERWSGLERRSAVAVVVCKFQWPVAAVPFGKNRYLINPNGVGLSNVPDINDILGPWDKAKGVSSFLRTTQTIVVSFGHFENLV
jgi:hypothetical protein